MSQESSLTLQTSLPDSFSTATVTQVQAANRPPTPTEARPLADANAAPIAPTTEQAAAVAAAGVALAQPLMAFGPGGRRNRVSQACESCRKRKVKCSGPQLGLLQTCRHCLEYRLECVWATGLKNRVAPGGSRGSKAKRANSALSQSLLTDDGADLGSMDGVTRDDSQAQSAPSAAPAAITQPHSKGKGARRSTNVKRQQQTDAREAIDSGAASDTPSSSFAAGRATSLPNTTRPHPSKSRRVETQLSSAPAAGPPSALSTLSNVRVATDHDVQELANHLTLVVSLDELGQTRGMSNYGTSTGLAALREWSPTVAQGILCSPLSLDRTECKALTYRMQGTHLHH
ncbi:hypothetical protein BCR44DRAFT_40571 [Catenaria anguillulae PL171]|uniref:Zn(2)-C6 fungal-type domain-containing protein n=1 Tax=Catenaria anguillulae PL171 TaxID=765915 RepID=A0A1Y2H7E6_9FUNG|nr:hypothetical protein BCR44DRAFT_40571 [Catenaria anguillulae PL171]